jgi:hypothetical protein
MHPTGAGGDYLRFAGLCAIAAAVGTLVFSLVFVVIVFAEPSGRWVEGLWRGLLLVGEIVAIAVLVGVYERLRAAGPGFALLGLLLGVVGAAGGIAHGGTQLAQVVTPEREAVDLDPEGIFRYGLAGLALLVLAWPMLHRRALPRMEGLLTLAAGFLLVLIYLGLLAEIITPADRLTLVPPIVFGFVVNPVWYAFVGRELLRSSRAQTA